MTYELRGFKGLWWEPEEYLGWPNLLGEAGYTSYMLCYTFAPESGLRWRRPFRSREEGVIRRLAADCDTRGIELNLAINPSIGTHAWTPEAATLPFHPTAGRDWFLRYWQSRRPNEALEPDSPFRYGSDEDLALLVGKLRGAAEWGVRSFTLSLDDIDPGATPAGFPSLAAAQAWLVAGVRAGLAGTVGTSLDGVAGRRDPGVGAGAGGAPRILFTPTFYWSEGARAHPEYWAELRTRLPDDVGAFWTGERVRTPGQDLIRERAREAATIYGRKPILWFNYGSNDSFRFAMQLPPGRPPRDDLGDELAGILVNPMRQAGLTRLHALVMGEYFRAPDRYAHAAALDRAARRLVGEASAHWLVRCAASWEPYPDVRTLGADIEREGAPLVDALLGRLLPAYGQLLAALASLERLDADRPRRSVGALIGELRRGADRYRLLVAALRARSAMADGDATGATEQRARVDAMLGAADDETASDARVVLDARLR